MSEPNVAVLQPGAIFHARYEVVRCLKSGGMGAIYEVIHIDTRRRRALKTMLPGLLADGDLRDRFKHEATVAAEIESEHIVETFDAGFDAETGLPFLVMELLKGQDLGAMMEKRGKIPGAEVVALLYQAALALNKTHAAGVVHRDLKPENLFVVRRDDGSPRLKLLDFGIAKLVAHGPLAKTTRLVGSPLYMSTEQIKGEGTIGPRADLYSLGQIAYALLVGEAYWEEESRATEAIYPLLLKIMLGAKVPATERAKSRVELPEAFDAWFNKATNAEPEERFGTASELVDALADALGVARPRGTVPEISDEAPALVAVEKSERPPPLAPHNTITESAVAVHPAYGSRRRLPILVGIAFVGLGVVVAFAMRKGTEPPKAVEAAAPVATEEAPTTTAAPQASSAPAVRPDPNAWVRVEPPSSPVLLGVSEDDAPRDVHGFRPARGIHAPTAAYEIQQHEVTWEELEPWLAQHDGFDFDHPTWLPRDAAERARLPATGVTWKAARAYCKDLGGSLPTEEQWEYAARGAERRPHAWGSQRIDLLRVRAFASEAQSDVAPKTRAPVAPVMTMEQDQTPGDPGSTIYDMTGNAMEWTADIYRESSPHVDETWTEEGGVSYRAVRGLPLDIAMPRKEPAETATWRTPLCATGPCPKKTAAVLQYVGFRCVKNVDRPHDVDPRAAKPQEKTAVAAPTAEPVVKGGKHAAAEPHAKATATPQAHQTGGIIGGEATPARPSQAAVSSAIGSAMGAAKACVAGADFDTFAKLNFASSGAVTSVNVTGWANAKGKSACVQAALGRVRVPAFTDPAYSARVTLKP